MSEKNFYPPSPPPGEPQQYGVPQRILATQAIPEERSELEKQAWSLMDSKLIPFTIAVFIFAGWVSELSDLFDFGSFGLNVVCHPVSRKYR